MRKVSDGWHVIQGHEVYVEDGKVLMGKADGKTVYPYRKAIVTERDEYGRMSKVWKGGWEQDCSISISAFSAGVKAGNVQMF